ncbi:hypothetical protein HYT55_00010 [Candidatus Woesearchaeota archaeon]|nr:hypothetical protein [Candidatus Woesearchaeota archaeon]
MKANRFVLFILVFLFLGVIYVSASCPPPQGEVDNLCFDPAHMELFDYQNGDYSSITDWSLVSWNLIPNTRIPEVPAQDLRYFMLSDGQRKAMTAQQIVVHFDKIDDLAHDVKPEEAQKAIKEKYRVVVELSGKKPKNQIISLKNGILKTGFGVQDRATLSSGRYTGGAFEISEEGSLIFIPAKTQKSIDIPASDRLIVDVSKGAILFRGNSFSKGRFVFNEGRTFILGFETVQLNRVLITSGNPDGLKLYFDGQWHEEEHYISMDTKKGDLYVDFTNGDHLEFLKGNVFVPNLEEKDRLVLSPQYPTTLSVISQRHGKDKYSNIPLVPEMRMSGEVIVENGRNLFVVRGGRLLTGINKESQRSGSVPLALVFLEKSIKVLTDEVGNYVTLPGDYENPFYECLSCTIDLTQNSRLQRDAKVTFLRSAKGIRLTDQSTAFGEAGSLELIAAARGLEKLTPALRKSTTDIILLSPKDFEKRCGQDADGCAGVGRGTIYLPKDDFARFSPEWVIEVVSHELGHNVEPDVDAVWEEAARLPNSALPYGKDLGEKTVGKSPLQTKGIDYRNAATWKGGGDEARYGCTRAYGCNNKQEDFATHIECAYTGSSCWYNLLNPEVNDWHEIHRKKFTIQCGHGYIPKDTCKKMGIQ